MTRFVGFRIKAAPCCGAQFRTKRYASMNFMATEYWTDGYRFQSLMPNDHGLRKCTCGSFYLVEQMVLLSEADASDLPYPLRVESDELPHVIQHAADDTLEMAARMDYWHALNHPYRERYRQHREKEEAATQARWEAAHPDRRTFLERLKKAPRLPRYQASADRPLTYPAFMASEIQHRNMERLLALLKQGVGHPYFAAEIVELHRELGQFDEAAAHLADLDDPDDSKTLQLMGMLIAQRDSAPVRHAG